MQDIIVQRLGLRQAVPPIDNRAPLLHNTPDPRGIRLQPDSWFERIGGDARK
jgi:hypothetical protein